jgi:UTP--glucose-1-phosphate uridylyltransferase
VLTPRIFDMLAEVVPGSGGEIQLTDGISALLKHEPAFAVRLPGRRYDCGSKLGYLQATVDYGLRHPETGEGFARYLKSRKDA